MRGFPKVLNSKQDFYNCLPVYPNETKAELQKLLDSRFSWIDKAIIDDDGITDSTHRVIENEGVKVQQELIDDPCARIYKLGFTIEDVEVLLG